MQRTRRRSHWRSVDIVHSVVEEGQDIVEQVVAEWNCTARLISASHCPRDAYVIMTCSVQQAQFKTGPPVDHDVLMSKNLFSHLLNAIDAENCRGGTLLPSRARKCELNSRHQVNCLYPAGIGTANAPREFLPSKIYCVKYEKVRLRL